MRFPAEEIGASEVSSTVGVVETVGDLVLRKADAGKYIPSVLVPKGRDKLYFFTQSLKSYWYIFTQPIIQNPTVQW